MKSNKININSSRKAYTVKFENQIPNSFNSLTKKYVTHFLIDENVYRIYKTTLDNFIKSAYSTYFFKPLERGKNLSEIYKFIDFLLEKKFKKKHKIIVVGGALVQDIGSFTSHIILRGVDWIFIPTTLLAMADSCIGSKSGINVGKFKNQVGAFHHPIKIYIFLPFLKTLPKSELINGIGEIIKHIFIKGEPFFSDIKKNLDKIGDDLKISQDIIYKSLLIKKDIIEKDEYEEKGIRKLLNYGHTFGHALEGYSGNKIPHGIAVINGIDIANFISFKRGFLPENKFLEFNQFIKKYIPYKLIPITDVEKYIQFLSRDKKAFGDSVDVILCKGVGKILVFKIRLDKKLTQEITEYFNIYTK